MLGDLRRRGGGFETPARGEMQTNPYTARALSLSVVGVAGVWFDWLTTNGKHTYVRPELVEGLIDAHFAKALVAPMFPLTET